MSEQPERSRVEPPATIIIPNRWRKLSALVGVMWADNNEGSVLSTLAPVILRSLGLANSAVGVLTALARAIAVLFGPLWVGVARRIGRKRTLIITTAGNMIFTAAAGFAVDFTTLALIWAGAAVFAAAALPIITEITSDLFDEKSRGRAVGLTFGVLNLIGSLLGPAIGQLARFDDGWRIGFWAVGGLTLLVLLFLIFGFQDPGVGATEPQRAAMTAEKRDEASRITMAKLRELVKVPTFLIMLGQRLLSGHLLVMTFGILLLVDVFGFPTEVAAIVAAPFGIGYLLGTIGGGLVVDGLQARMPRIARPLVLQMAQLLFGLAALLATQFNWGTITVYAALWGVLGFLQGVNPGVNRPIVMSVVRPELRGAAFAIMLSIFEAIAFVIFNLGAGFLSDVIGLQATFLWVCAVLMFVNAAYCTLLYFTYPRDVARLQAELDEEASR